VCVCVGSRSAAGCVCFFRLTECDFTTWVYSHWL